MSNRKMQKSAKPSDDLDTGIGKDDRKKVAEHVARVLADTYVLMVKSHAYHWNVVGPLFIPFHELTEKHYENLFAAADELAERIRSLGHTAPSAVGEFLRRAELDDAAGDPDAMTMVENLVADHETISQRLREAANVADDADDLVTADLLTQRLAFHEKAIWMLRAIAGK